jgi:hypothetical protein
MKIIQQETSLPDKFLIRRRLGSVLLERVEDDQNLSEEELPTGIRGAFSGRRSHAKPTKTVSSRPPKSKQNPDTLLSVTPIGEPELSLSRVTSIGLTARNRWVSTRIKDPAIVSALTAALTAPPTLQHLGEATISTSSTTVSAHESPSPYMPSLSVRQKSKRGRTSVQDIFEPGEVQIFLQILSYLNRMRAILLEQERATQKASPRDADLNITPSKRKAGKAKSI